MRRTGTNDRNADWRHKHYPLSKTEAMRETWRRGGIKKERGNIKNKEIKQTLRSLKGRKRM